MEYLNDFAAPYVDDILVSSRDSEEHERHLRKLLTCLREVGLHADIDKCHFFADEVRYLGIIISKNRVHVDPKKVQAIVDWP